VKFNGFVDVGHTRLARLICALLSCDGPLGVQNARDCIFNTGTRLQKLRLNTVFEGTFGRRLWLKVVAVR
jgi:hypothetical protein